MRFKRLVVCIALPLLVGLFVFYVPATAQSKPNEHFQIVESDEQSLVLTYSIGEYQVKSIVRDGRPFHSLTIPGTVQTQAPGEPQMPTLGTLVGIPTRDGLTLEVVNTEYDLLEDIRLNPTPRVESAADVTNLLEETPQQLTRESFAIDEAAYAQNSFSPALIAHLGKPSSMRDQTVVNVQITPVQFNPVMEQVRLYRQVTVRISWDAKAVAANVEQRFKSSAYENLLEETVLNYEQLGRTKPGPLQIGDRNVQAASLASESEAVTNTLKLGIVEDGLYQINYSDLAEAGVLLDEVDPHTFQLHNQNVELPIMVDGESDGVFDPSDQILFYGQAITDVYTFENVYWLSWDNAESGLRMPIIDGTVSGEATTPEHFPTLLHLEEDTHYWQTMPDSEGEDHWFWDRFIGPAASRFITPTLNHISTDVVSATVQVRLKGRTDTGQAPDHHTKIYLNNQLMSESLWDGRIIFDQTFTFTQSLLFEGDNFIRIENVGDTGAETDQVLLNWINIDYWDRYVAENNQLRFSAPSSGSHEFALSGFSDSNVTIFDVTNPHSLRVISNTETISNSGQISIHFEDNATTETRYLAITPNDYKSPASIEREERTAWKSPTMGADYILITHSDFYTDALRLAEYRRSSGLRVETVKVQDIYDEFNGGVFNPEAIHQFLTYAYEEWVSPAPTYVLLLGDAAQDYRDILGFGENNFVPSQIFLTDILGETPTDNSYVTVSGEDKLPDMFIGRLSVQSATEAQIVVEKIIGYETEPPTPDWNNRSLLIADDEARFETISEEIAERLPNYYDIQRFYKEEIEPEDPVGTLVNAIDSGNVLINYSGHGNINLWGDYDGIRLMEPDVISTLNNVGKLPLLTVANCLNGFFVGSTSRTSLAESMTRLDGKGAIAVWAPTDLNYPSGHRQIISDFYDKIFQDDTYSLGQATTAAKISTYAVNEIWEDLIQAYVLFGDPAMEIGIPANVPYIEDLMPSHQTENVAIDQPLQIDFNKPIITETVQLTITSSAAISMRAIWTDTNRSVSFVGGPFEHDTTYTFIVTGQDRLGNELSPFISPTTGSFTTSADASPPEISLDTGSTSPSRIPTSDSITVEFNEAVRIESVQYTIEPQAMVEATWDNLNGPTGQRLTLRPLEPFAKMQDYTITVRGATDVAGNTLAAPLVVDFTTLGDFDFTYLPFVGQ